jgi:hypothetical protein
MAREIGRGGVLKAVVASCLLSWTATTGIASPDNPFEQLAGYWKGSGDVAVVGGNRERIICRVTYRVSGSNVSQNMNCAGSDYKLQTVSQLTYANGRISGSWTESNFDAAGDVDGVARGNTIHANITGNKFSGRMSISISGRSHTVNLTQLDRQGQLRPVAVVSLSR